MGTRCSCKTTQLSSSFEAWLHLCPKNTKTQTGRRQEAAAVEE